MSSHPSTTADSLSGEAPKVSVIVPNYNHAQFLAKRLDSILGQTFTDFELIILDDASTDGSQEVIASYLPDPRVRFYPNASNSGSSFVQWNRGVQLARGQFIWIAESDDYAGKDFLATLVPALAANPKLGLVYCQSWRVDELNNPCGTFEEWTADLDAARWQTGFTNCGRSECANYLLWKNTVPNASAVLLRKETYLQAGQAPESMRLCGDWMTWVRVLLISDVAFLPARLNYYRQHSASVRETTSTQKYLDEKWAVQLLILRSCKLPMAARRKLAFRVLDEFIYRIRSSSEPRRELARVISLYWPMFAREPGAVFLAILRRLMLTLRRRIPALG